MLGGVGEVPGNRAPIPIDGYPRLPVVLPGSELCTIFSEVADHVIGAFGGSDFDESADGSGLFESD